MQHDHHEASAQIHKQNMINSFYFCKPHRSLEQLRVKSQALDESDECLKIKINN